MFGTLPRTIVVGEAIQKSTTKSLAFRNNWKLQEVPQYMGPEINT
jgi:hypothetical protein